ncbi:MAG: hypothetical protein HRU00_02635 [Myxococcales bacterium]|nr:hypothetical protein [Myxococcales bacterium]
MRPENEEARTGTVQQTGGASGSAGAAEPFGSVSQEGPPDAKRSWRHALSLIESGAHEEGLAELEQAFEVDGLDPECQSAYALGLALAHGRFPEAVVLAQQAARSDHRNPGLYLNLARIHLIAGSRADAVQCLTRGLRAVPEHAGLLEARAELGFRHRIWLRFLPRGHWLNRGLGLLSARLRLRISDAP